MVADLSSLVFWSPDIHNSTTTSKLIGYTEVSFLYSDAVNGTQLAMLVFSIINSVSLSVHVKAN